jgi:hypothetical protein
MTTGAFSTLKRYTKRLPILSHQNLVSIYSYRTSKHVFTVLPPTFLSSFSSSPYYIALYKSIGAKLNVNSERKTTVLPNMFLPYFQTWNYRTSKHTATVLPNMFFNIHTVLSPIKRVTKLLRSLSNLIDKDVLKLVYKNNISFDGAILCLGGRN